MRKDLTYRLPEVGRIKIGRLKAKRTTSSGGKDFAPPEKLDHFIICTMERDTTTGQLKLDPIMKTISPKGDPIRELDVVLLHDDPTANFFSCYSYYYGRGKVFCRGDGHTAQRMHVDERAGARCPCRQNSEAAKHHQNGEVETIEAGGCGRRSNCPFIRRNGKGETRCKPEGVLRCVLPVQRLVGGTYVFRSHGWNTVDDLEAALMHYASITGGYLAGIPFKLVIAPTSRQVEGVGSVTVYTVKLLYEPKKAQSGYQELMELARNRARLIAQHRAEVAQIESLAAAQLEQSVSEMPDEEAAEVTAEYYPQNASEETAQAEGPEPAAEDLGAEPAQDSAETEAAPEPAPQPTKAAPAQGRRRYF